MHYGFHVKQIRIKAGLSQAELAGFLCLSKSLVYYIEKGERELPTEALYKIGVLEKAIDIKISFEDANAPWMINLRTGIEQAVAEAKQKKEKTFTHLERLIEKEEELRKIVQQGLIDYKVAEVMTNYNQESGTRRLELWLNVHDLRYGKKFTDVKLKTLALLHLEIEAVKSTISIYDEFIQKFDKKYLVNEIYFLENRKTATNLVNDEKPTAYNDKKHKDAENKH